MSSPPQPDHLTHPKYRPDIDGLRAIAVLSVVIYHAFPKFLRGGFIGVDIFFVISGFLISTIIMGSLERNSFSFIEFYSRRIKRIFPALILVLVASFVVGWFALLPYEYRQLGKHIAGGAGFVSNFLFWNESGYFDKAAGSKPLLHLWSLGIEEQFYIVWPLLLWLAWKKRFNLLTITMVVAAISFALNISQVHGDKVALFYSPQTRFWELLVGSVLAYMTLHRQYIFPEFKHKLDSWLGQIIYGQAAETNGKILRNVQSMLGAVLILAGLLVITRKWDFPGWGAILPTAGALLIISAGVQSWFNRVVLSNRVLVWFGLISFPLYLWHWPLLSFASIIEIEPPSLQLRIVAVMISIALAWLTYKFIEKPIRFGKHDKASTICLVGLMAAIGYFGYHIFEHDGFKHRFNKNTLALAEIITNPLPEISGFDCAKSIKAFKNIRFDGGCKLSKESAPTIMFVGDSHTLHFRNAVWKHFPNDSVLMIVEFSCLPFSADHFLQGECKEKYNSVIDFIDKNKSIKTVYLSGYWAYLMSGGFIKSGGNNWRKAKPLDDEGAKSFKENGVNFISKILNSNKEVVFIKDIPDLDFNVETCFDFRPHIPMLNSTVKKECSLDFDEYQKRVEPYDKVVNEILTSFPHIEVYDPRPLFCGDGRCFAANSLLPYYFNGDHLNYYGADLVVKDLLSKFPVQ